MNPPSHRGKFERVKRRWHPGGHELLARDASSVCSLLLERVLDAWKKDIYWSLIIEVARVLK